MQCRLASVADTVYCHSGSPAERHVQLATIRCQTKSCGQLCRHGECVFGGQHGGNACIRVSKGNECSARARTVLQLCNDGVGCGLGRVASHRCRVAEAEVDVLVAVHVWR